MDDGSNQRDIIPNTYDAHNLWAPSDFDARHVLIVNFLYELPSSADRHNLAGKLLGGWQVSGIFQAQTGQPISVGTRDYAGVGQDGSMDGNEPSSGISTAVRISPQQMLPMAAVRRQVLVQHHELDGTPIFTAPATGTFVTQNVRNADLQSWLQQLEPRPV